MHRISPNSATSSHLVSFNTPIIKDDSTEIKHFTEQMQRVDQWNSTQHMYPLDVCIPQLIATITATAPDAVAIATDNQSISYKELNQRTNQLAHYLQTLGVGQNVLVGLCVERSLDMVVGMLGILKAGGAYVPLDATYPAERLAFMLEDAQPSVLLTQTHVATRLPSNTAKVIAIDDTAIFEQQSVTEPISSITGDDLVYVIYTSGSTGQPKGVQITHRNLLNLLFWHQQAFHITSADRATQLTSPAFDATGWEIWPYLTSGASIYLPDEDTRVSPTLLRDWLTKNNITIAFLPTVLAESIMDLEWSETTSLRFLLTGADTLHHFPSPTLPFALINNYGPTEATVVATSGPVLPVGDIDGPPSIGRPIANTQVYILDEQLHQVPIGEVGELYIGGAGLAKGYLNRPELTAEKFIPHPFKDELGARLYKTGDLARYHSDGQLLFMGRIDHQIKIRGYRIEPNEIIAALNEHPAVQTSTVIALEDMYGDKRLVAYLVQASEACITATSLREILSMRLPDYMIPVTFVLLKELPMTHNGKIDRLALPEPDASNTLSEAPSTAPTTPLEERLTEIVAPLLKLEQVGIDDNFFLLGGHSLLGTQLIVQVAETFGINLSLRSLFEAPTVRLLSAEIERLIIAKIEKMSDEEAVSLLE